MKYFAKPLQLLIKVAISCLFFSILLSFVQTNELMTVFANVNWFYLLVSFLVTFIMVAASCAKWKLVLDLKAKQRISFAELMKIYCIGYFFSNILPSTVGGDVVRSYYAGKLIDNQPFSAVCVFVERFSGVFFLFFLVVVAPVFRPALYTNPYIYIPALSGLFFAAVTLWIWKAQSPFHWAKNVARGVFAIIRRVGVKTGANIFVRVADSLERVFQALLGKASRLREELHVAVHAVRSNRAFLGRLVFWTVLFYMLTWVNVFTAFLAFGVDVDFLAICAVVPAIMLVAHVPVTLLGNLGYFESVFVFYFLLVGVGGAETLAMGLLLRVKMLTMGLIGFGVYMIYRQRHRLDIKDTDCAPAGKV